MNYRSFLSGINILLFVFVSTYTHAQVQEVVNGLNDTLSLVRKVDSLKGLSFNNKLAEIKNIRAIIRTYRDLNNDSALVYCNRELEIAEQMEDFNEVARARMNSSNILNQLGKFEAAKNILLNNLRESHRINDTILAITKSGLSNIYLNTEEYDQSIIQSLAAAKAFEQLKDSSNAGFSYISIAEVYSLALENNIDAIKYSFGAVSVFKR